MKTLITILCLLVATSAFSATQIQLRNDTAANWTSSNPILAQGERGIEIDTGKEKSGDGTTAWSSLAYWSGGPATTSVAGSMSAVDKKKADATQNAEYNIGTCTTAATINASNGTRQKITLTNAQTCALTFTQPSDSRTMVIGIKVIQSAAGSFNGSISGGKWSGGTVPTITATTGAVDFVSCYLDGTNAYCAAAQDVR